jgi:hypothetical protein
MFSLHIYRLIFRPPDTFLDSFFFLEVQRGGGTLGSVREIRGSDGVFFNEHLHMGCCANPSRRNFRTFQKNILLPFLE